MEQKKYIYILLPLTFYFVVVLCFVILFLVLVVKQFANESLLQNKNKKAVLKKKRTRGNESDWFSQF